MGLDMNLHKALEKLAEDTGTFGGGKARTEAEERDLGGCCCNAAMASPRRLIVHAIHQSYRLGSG